MRPSTHLELYGIDELATLVTLVTAGLLIATEGTHTLHKAVSQEAGTPLTTQLLHSILQHKTSVPQSPKDVLCDSGEVSKGQGREKSEKSEERLQPSLLLLYPGPKLI